MLTRSPGFAASDMEEVEVYTAVKVDVAAHDSGEPWQILGSTTENISLTVTGKSGTPISASFAVDEEETVEKGQLVSYLYITGATPNVWG